MLTEDKDIFKLFKLMAIGIVVSAIGYYFYHQWDDSEYPWLTYELSLTGKIKSSSPYQSIVRVELTDGTKYKITHARNYAYEPYELNMFVSAQDSIFKSPNSDTIKIKRQSETFEFVLTKDLNETLRNDR